MTHARLFSGRYYLGHGRSFGVSSTTPTANVLYAIPFEQRLVIDALALHNKGGGSNSPLARIGLYDHDASNGLPGDLIEGSDEISMSSGNQGIKIFELAEAYGAADPFWVAAVFAGDPCSDVAACSIASGYSQEIFGNNVIDSTFMPRHGIACLYTFGALPSTFPTEGVGPMISTMALAVRGA